MSLVAVYIRVSTEKQAEQGMSLAEQERSLTAFCSRSGDTIVETFIDAGVSGRTDLRPEFQRMIGMASEKPAPFSKIVVYNWSRFFRNTSQALMYQTKLEKLGVTIQSMTENFGGGATGRFGLTTALAAHEFISDMNGENALRGHLENAENGFLNGKPPYGYKAVEAERRGEKIKKRAEIEPQEAEVVRLIFKLYLEGDGKSGALGVKKIVNYLNEKGFRLRGGSLFNVKKVDEILRGTTYMGKLYYNKRNGKTKRLKPENEWKLIPVPAIIDEAKFNAAQKLLTKRAPKMTPPRVTSSPNLLTGLMKCGYCGGAMVKGSGKGISYYRCVTHLRKGKDGCHGQWLRMDKVDEIVTHAVVEKVTDETRLKQLMKDLHKKAKSGAEDGISRKAELDRKERALNKEVENLLTLVAQGLMSADDPHLKTEVGKRKAQIDDIIRQKSMIQRDNELPVGWAAPRRVNAFAAGLREMLKNGDIKFRQEYLRLFVDGIEAKKDEISIWGSDDLLAATIANSKSGKPDEVRSFAREWRPLGDSNPCRRRERAVS